MSQYATRSGFDQFGLPAAMTVGISDGRIDPFLVAASSKADGALRAIGALPLVEPYPIELVQAVCQIAAFEVARVLVGFNPALGEDDTIRAAAKDAHAWLRDLGAGNVLIYAAIDQTPGHEEDSPEVFSDPGRGI